MSFESNVQNLITTVRNKEAEKQQKLREEISPYLSDYVASHVPKWKNQILKYASTGMTFTSILLNDRCYWTEKIQLGKHKFWRSDIVNHPEFKRQVEIHFPAPFYVIQIDDEGFIIHFNMLPHNASS